MTSFASRTRANGGWLAFRIRLLLALALVLGGVGAGGCARRDEQHLHGGRHQRSGSPATADRRPPLCSQRSDRSRGDCSDGGYLIADARNARVRRVFPDGTINTVAGTGTFGFSGDGGPATAADLRAPIGVAALPDGGFLITDAGAAQIRRVSATGIITTVAGTDARVLRRRRLGHRGGDLRPERRGGDTRRWLPDRRHRQPGCGGCRPTGQSPRLPAPARPGSPATAARRPQRSRVNSPYSVAVTADGGFLIGDEVNRRVRRVSPTGIITAVAGTGVQGSSGDGGAATAAQLNVPTGSRPPRTAAS